MQLLPTEPITNLKRLKGVWAVIRRRFSVGKTRPAISLQPEAVCVVMLIVRFGSLCIAIHSGNVQLNIYATLGSRLMMLWRWQNKRRFDRSVCRTADIDLSMANYQSRGE